MHCFSYKEFTEVKPTKIENWRVKYLGGTRKEWVYLTDEEAAKWPLSDLEKYNLGLLNEDHLKGLNKATTPLEAAQNAYRLMKRAQSPDGDFPGVCTDVQFLTPMYTFAFYALGFEIPEHQRMEQIRYILSLASSEDGGWAMAPGDPSTVFGTSLNYTSLRILGLSADHPAMKKARMTLKGMGGVLCSSIWGKFWLAILNLYDWEGLNSIPPEIWLLPDWLPFHPSKWYMFIRSFHHPMSYLYRVRFVAPLTDLGINLRKELYVEDYETIDWPKWRDATAQGDEHVGISTVMKIAFYFFNNFVEKYPIGPLVRRALHRVYEQSRFELENTNYYTIVSCCAALHLIVQSHANGIESETVKKQKEAIKGYLWMSPEGMHVTVSTGIPAWAGALMAHALVETGLCDLEENQESIERLVKFFEDEQMLDNSKHWPEDYRQYCKGGWVFGLKNENGYLLTDCTGETLSAIMRLSHILKPEDRFPEWRLRLAVDLLLMMQSADGGFPAYERRRGSDYLELLNPSQEFDAVMVDYSAAEVTTSASGALCDFREKYNYRSKDIDHCLKRVVAYLHNTQHPSGGWTGFWGIYMLYGTFFALRGLSKIGKEYYSNSEYVRHACDFVVSVQHDDGGWGEDRSGVKLKQFVQGSKANMAQTSWAVLGLMYAKYPDKSVIQRAVKRVMDEQLPDGSWPSEGPTGFAFTTFAVTYPFYKIIFPTWMLGVAHRYLDEEPM
ncbi:terpene synthase [Cyathus striatus]|nr:terpene synthase [Cyathus striatus]